MDRKDEEHKKLVQSGRISFTMRLQNHYFI